MSDLITIAKLGEGKINIHPAALKDHKRLGWVEVPFEAPEVKEDKPSKKAEKETLSLDSKK